MKKVILGILIVGMLTLGIYTYLGGFKNVEYQVINCQDLALIGLEYKGTPQEEGLREAFKKVESMRGNLPLSTVYFVEPAGKTDTLHVFVGMDRAGFSGDAKGLDQIQYNCKKAVKASMSMHRLVMPSPQKVKEGLNVFAKEEGMELQGVFIDRILNQDMVEVLAPLK